MKQVTYSNAFYRDAKRLKKRGKDLDKLFAIVDQLAKDQPLAIKHKPHPLKGEWHSKWDCHIEPDWILIYEITEDKVIVFRTGSHSDLFK